MFSEQLTGVVVEGAAALAGGYLRQMACENLKCKRNAISFAALPLDIRYIFYFVFGGLHFHLSCFILVDFLLLGVH